MFCHAKLSQKVGLCRRGLRLYWPGLPFRPRSAFLAKGECAVVAARGGYVPYALIHRRQLVVADDIAALYVLLVLGALVGDMVDEDDAVARLGIEDDVLLRFAPGFKPGPVEGVEVGGAPSYVRL